MSTHPHLPYIADSEHLTSSIRGPITAARYHQLRTQIVEEFGLEGFETIEATRKRQQRMLRGFGKAGIDSDLWRPLLKCNATGCRCDSAACWYGQHLLRLELIPLILSSPSVRDRHRWFATWVDVIRVPAGKLSELDPADCVATVRDSLACLSGLTASSVSAFGSFELSLNVERDGTAAWNVHIHLVTNGLAKARLKQAAARSPSVSRVPLQMRPIKSLPQVLQYCLKRFPQERRAYLAPTGNRRNDFPLRAKDQLEHDEWLLGLRLTDRLLIYVPTPP